MASFSPYKSEGFIKEVSTNVAFTCLLSHCHRSLVIWCHSALYFGRYPQPKSYLLQRAQKNVAKILQFAANSFSDSVRRFYGASIQENSLAIHSVKEH